MYVPQFSRLDTSDAKKILKVIKETKRKLNKLKNKMENPCYDKQEIISPSDLTIYKCEREFLDMAITKYICLTGDYKYTKEEEKAIEFENSLKNLVKVTHQVSCFFNCCIEPIEIDITKLDIEDKNYFINSLNNLRIGEWRKNYNPERFGQYILDGEYWDLIFEFDNGKTVKYGGHSTYPYNYNELITLIEEMQNLSEEIIKE